MSSDEASKFVVKSYFDDMSYAENDVIYKAYKELCGQTQTLLGFWFDLLSGRIKIQDLLSSIPENEIIVLKRVLLFAEAELHTHGGQFEDQIAVIKIIKQEIKFQENRKKYGKL